MNLRGVFTIDMVTQEMIDALPPEDVAFGQNTMGMSLAEIVVAKNTYASHGMPPISAGLPGILPGESRGDARQRQLTYDALLPFDSGAQLSAPAATNAFGSGRIRAAAGATPMWVWFTLAGVGVLAGVFLLTKKKRR